MLLNLPKELMHATPTTDQMLKVFRLVAKGGVLFNETITQGQKIIMECILNREAADGSGKCRIHIMAHTRYGKSLAVGAAVGIRASVKHEEWAIVAGTKDQAQIIMDHVITFITNDPILRTLLDEDPTALIKNRKRRNFITFKGGGSVRAYTTGPDGDLVMGQGCANVIQDESALISDVANGKVERMLGDNPHDYFFVKIGNPFHNNHFQEAFLDEAYFHINIDYKVGIAEGRLTEDFVETMRKKPNFDILYANVFPDATAADSTGYSPLFTHALLKRAECEIDAIQPAGNVTAGADPADGGDCESTLVKKWMNLARVVYHSTKPNSVEFATEIATRINDCSDVFVDKQGVGSGTVNTLDHMPEAKGKLTKVNTGLAVPSKTPDSDQFLNIRAYIFWQTKLWLESGGRLEKHEGWKQLLSVKYKTNSKGKIQIIPKEILRKTGVTDIGVADALSMNFMPRQPRMTVGGVVGGVDTFASMRR